VTAASLDGAPLAITRTKRGVRLEGLSMLPSPAYQVAVLQMLLLTTSLLLLQLH
jgi:hypothetical protein